MALRLGAALAGLMALAGPARPEIPPPSASAAASSSFEEAARRATEAREGGRLGEAVQLYQEAVGLRPDWAEGWWFLGTLAYERDDHRQCRDAFQTFLDLASEAGAGWAFRGLCEFQLGEYPSAAQHLDKARSLGVGDRDLLRVVQYHQVLLLIRAGAFEAAIAPLGEILQAQPETPELATACGLLLLRRPLVPAEIAAADRELVRLAGGAYCAHLAFREKEARTRYEALLERYPNQRHLHYGLGLTLAAQGLPEAVDQHRREIALHPDHLLAHIELAFGLLQAGESAKARQAAEAAVRLDPENFATHLALGRALVAEGDLVLGIYELETAARLAPGIAETFWALARAYTGAGRREDAARAREVYQALEAARRQRDARPTSPPPSP